MSSNSNNNSLLKNLDGIQVTFSLHMMTLPPLYPPSLLHLSLPPWLPDSTLTIISFLEYLDGLELELIKWSTPCTRSLSLPYSIHPHSPALPINLSLPPFLSLTLYITLSLSLKTLAIITAFLRILMAYSWLVAFSLHMMTLPKVPLPRTFRKSKSSRDWGKNEVGAKG